ncbi:MAG: acetyl-CoA carboxylase biotin carboxyl carrier protein [Parvicellaceae bacterium]|jgi:acetyl-CoA carboxylase biotin carboxyl carrier protein
MKLNEIQELIKFVAKAGVNEVMIENKDFKICIKSESLARKKTNQGPEQVVMSTQVVSPGVVAAPIVAAPVAANLAPAAVESNADAGSDDSAYHNVKSPMIGTFYRKPTPDKPEFVQVGDTVKAGDTLCVVEAMKLFNEIEADVSGTIVKVLVDDSTPIEYDQPLFLIDPS